MRDALHDELAVMGVEHWWYRGRRLVLAAVMERWLPPVQGRRILEIGAGTGSVTMLLTRFGGVTAVEPHAGARAECAALAPGATVLAGSIGHLPSEVESADPFDVVCAFDVIEHVQDDIAGLEVMRERAAPDGRLVVTVPALEMLWGAHDEVNGHFRRYSRPELTRALRFGGWQPLHVSYFSSMLFPVVAGVRVGRRVVGEREGEPESDFRLPPARVNTLLTRVFGAEARWLARRSLPIGSSLVAVSRPA